MSENRYGATACANELRERYSAPIIEHLTNCGEDPQQTGTNKWDLPCVDLNGDNATVRITVSVVKGSKGEEYDPYAEAEAYRVEAAAKAEKKRLAAEAKAKKIERDKAQRKSKAKDGN